MKSADKPGSEGSPSYPSTFSEAALTGALKPTFSAASRKHPARDHLSDGILSQTAQSFNFGEIHAVQERFQALLKQRLRLEYENKPPLFPWESEVSEYPAEVADFAPVGVGGYLTGLAHPCQRTEGARAVANCFTRCSI